MQRLKRCLVLLLILVLVVPGLTFAQNQNNLSFKDTKMLERVSEKFNLDSENEKAKLDEELLKRFEDEDEVRIIVELKSDPAIVYATKQNMSYHKMSRDSLSRSEQSIEKEQKSVKNEILSKKVDMEHLNSFNTVFNGFSGNVKFKDIEVIENLPQVKKVYISNEYEKPEMEPHMGTSNDMIHAPATWEIDYKGEGNVIAIIDTGIDPSHRDMKLSEGIETKIDEETLIGKDLLGKYYTEKVPYGYNYYDLNNEILDLGPNPSMHGMHVAGTAGANGDIENGGIKGVAPESQLLAMKVFSNDPIYATTFSDIYLVAIDEAIRLGADVLNMSLGSTASFYNPDSAEDIAITNATDNGIVCSVSAGNSASMTDGWDSEANYGFPWKENPDIGVVGAPGLNKDTISVASIENTHQKVNALTYMKDDEQYTVTMAIAGKIDPSKELTGPQEFVDVIDGSPEHLIDVEGKVVIAVRGGDTPNFTDKIEEAQKAGAAGIIVRNHEAGGEELISMATPDEHTIPAVFIGYKHGAELIELEDKTIIFTDELMTIPNGAAGEMSGFTSWGVTPSLELKPEITAPGGQIYSTLNDDKYGIMSGTSMSAPHVAGGSALVMNYIQEHEIYKSLSLAEQSKLAKVILMNTANVVFDEFETEYSPRRQGAGLMNLYSAVSTPVRVVEATTNEAKVELKDFEDTSFTMKLKAINDGDISATYKVDTAVLADHIQKLGEVELNVLASDYIYDAKVTTNLENDILNIPANGEVTFEVTVDISEDNTVYRNMFVEGFVTLTDPDDVNPDISVPYVGFYGDWGEPNILDGMRFIDEEGKSYYDASGMLHWDKDGGGRYYTTPNIYMNPGTVAGHINGTGNIMPYLSFMRNAEWVDYNILDGEGNLLRTILKQKYKRKNYIDGGRRAPVEMIFDGEWYGEINEEIVPDGDYFYEINTKTHYEGSEIQSKRIPITVDTVGPEISNMSYDSQSEKLTWDGIDEGIGTLGFIFNINGEEIEEVVHGEEGKTSYELDMKPYIGEKLEYLVEIISVDKLQNMNFTEFTFNIEKADGHIYILKPELLGIYDKNEILFEGYVTNLASLEKILVNTEEADFEFEENAEIRHPDDSSSIIYSGPAFKFTKLLTLEDGYQEAKIEAITEKGESSSLIRRFYVDTTAPTLDINVLNIDKESKTAELEISMMDNLGHLALYLGDSQIFVYDYPLIIEEPADESINYTVDLKEGKNPFEFTLIDGAGHSTIESIDIVLDTNGEEPVPAIKNIEPSKDIQIQSGESVEISFEAPEGGSGYYKVILPLGLNSNSQGTPLSEHNGLYSGTWESPRDLIASDLQIEVIYIDGEGRKLIQTSEGKITVFGHMENLVSNSVILGDEAFDMNYLNKNGYAQSKLIKWLDSGKQVYYKIDSNTLVNKDGQEANINELPVRLSHIDIHGNVTHYQK